MNWFNFIKGKTQPQRGSKKALTFQKLDHIKGGVEDELKLRFPDYDYLSEYRKDILDPYYVLEFSKEWLILIRLWLNGAYSIEVMCNQEGTRRLIHFGKLENEECLKTELETICRITESGANEPLNTAPHSITILGDHSAVDLPFKNTNQYSFSDCAILWFEMTKNEITFISHGMHTEEGLFSNLCRVHIFDWEKIFINPQIEGALKSQHPYLLSSNELEDICIFKYDNDTLNLSGFKKFSLGWQVIEIKNPKIKMESLNKKRK